MQGNEFIWITSILVGIAVVSWLVLDWLESSQHWEMPEVDPKLVIGQSEQARLDTLDVESELVQGFPMDSYSPALLWRLPSQAQSTPAASNAAMNTVPVTDDEMVVPTTPFPSEAS